MKRSKPKEGVTTIRMPSHYTTAVLANRDELSGHSMSEEARHELVTGFESIELTSTEHRALFALFKLYNERGFTDATIQSGVTFTPYELCKAMGYKSYGSSSYPGTSRTEALSALNSLSDKRYRCLFTIHRNPNTRKIAVVAIPNRAVLEVSHRYEGMTFHEVRGKLMGASPEEITAKVCEQLVHAKFWRPMDTDFYDRLRSSGVRVNEEHWLLQYWLMRSEHPSRSATFDELLKVLKLDQSKTHRSRQRNFVLRIYKDFQRAGYLSKVHVDRKSGDGRVLDYLEKALDRY
ncbi:hypothetical protein WDW37_07440 [Bdellovibrionota bacterium FG-1]